MPKYRRGSGSVYTKKGTPFYYIAYYDADGQQHCESSRTKDPAEARRILTAKQADIAKGKPVPSHRVTFATLLDRLVTDYENNKRDSTKEVKARIENYIKPFFRDIAAHRVTAGMITDYVTHHTKREVFPNGV
jgi:hypothetical protein